MASRGGRGSGLAEELLRLSAEEQAVELAPFGFSKRQGRFLDLVRCGIPVSVAAPVRRIRAGIVHGVVRTIFTQPEHATAMTLNTYSHVLRSLQTDAAAKINAILGGM